MTETEVRERLEQLHLRGARHVKALEAVYALQEVLAAEGEAIKAELDMLYDWMLRQPGGSTEVH